MKNRFLWMIFSAWVAVSVVSRLPAQGGPASGVPVRAWAQAQAGILSWNNFGYAGSPSYLGGIYDDGTRFYYYDHTAWIYTFDGDEVVGVTAVYVYRYTLGTQTQVYGNVQVTATFMASSPTANDGAISASASGGTSGEVYSLAFGVNGIVRMEPGKSYTVNVSQQNIVNGTFNLVAPPQYRVVLNGQVRNSCPLDTVTVSIVPRNEGPPGAAGFASSVAGSRVDWKLALGSLHNGDDAGSLRLVDSATAADWSPLFTPAMLNYESTSDEVFVYRQNNIIRQVIANQVAVDVVTLNSTSYELRCYNPTQISAYGTPCTFTGSPYATYKVEQGSTATALKFTKTAGSQTQIMTMQRSGAWPNFAWASSDWTQSGQTSVVTTATQGSGTLETNGTVLSRSETSTVAGPSNATVLTLTRGYTLQNFGEVLSSETVGSSNSQVANFSYFSDITQPGSLGYVKSVTLNSGRWEAYDYEDSGQAESYSGGHVQHRYRPFGNTPATVATNTSQGEVTSYGYSSDPFGFGTRPAFIQTSVNGTITATSTINYDSVATSGLITATRSDFYTVNAAQTTVTEFYSEASSDTLIRGKTYSVQQPDGVKQSYVYQWGSLSGTTFTPGSAPSNNGSGASMACRVGVITGSSSSSAGSACTSYGGFTVSSLYLVDGKSTLELTIRDQRALVVRTESYMWKSNAWQLVSYVDFTYNTAGLLTNRVGSNGATYTASYDGLQKTSETDESGVITNFTYDVGGRLLTSARQGSGAIGALTTSMVYDAMGNVLEQHVGSGEQLVATHQYDDAGRLVGESQPGGIAALAHSYDIANRTHTVTAADGSTTIETTNLDGTLASKTGTAVVPEYHTYGVETTGSTASQRWHQVFSGTNGTSSPRYTKSWTDRLGRTVHTEHPGFTGQPVVAEDITYDSVGHKTKSAKTGYAPTLYQYNVLGQVSRSGLDYDNNGSLALASNDRITDTDTYLESYNSAWWLRTDTKTYPNAGAATVITTSTTRKRLTAFTTNQVAESQSIDAEGNVTDESSVVNRSAKTAVKNTTRTGLSGSQVENSLNGYPTSSTSFDGLTTSMAYDALLRKASVTDSRSNTTTNAYVTGTALVLSVTDGAGYVSLMGHDSLGRVISQRDPQNKWTRSEYNLRGQVIHQWGNGALPVAYGFDSTFGDKVTMSTFRAGSGWDSDTGDHSNTANPWPTATTGTADTTTWAYDGPSGLLTTKTDALGRAVTQSYNLRGQTATRTLARGSTAVTTYGYDSATGELLTQTYSDTTPAVTYTYGRTGQVESVSDFTGLRDMVYDTNKPWRLSAEAESSFYGNRVYTRLYDNTTVLGRVRGFQIGTTAGDNTDVEQTFGYTSVGRFDTLTSARQSDTATRTFQYGYLANSALLSSVGITGSHPFTITRSYEAHRDLIMSINAQWSTTSRTEYDYTYDERGQRGTAVQSGDAFSDYGDSTNNPGGATHRIFTYDGRGEVTGDVAYLNGTATDQTLPMPGRRHEYAYDNIGNRQTSNRSGVSTLADHYTTNAANQYVTRENNTVPVSGTAAPDASGAGGTAVSVKGGTLAPVAAGRQGRYWNDEITVNNNFGPTPTTADPNNPNPWRGALTIFTAKRGTGGSPDLYRADSRMAEIGARLQTFSYDLDGNLLSDGLVDYQWDAENRLIRMETSTLAQTWNFPHKLLEFRYDYLGRRVQKRVVDVDQNQEVSCRRFLYDGWSLIAEYAAPGGTSIGALLRSYTWGLDIARSLTDAGGVGALLQIADHTSGNTYLPTYDGNGNIIALLNSATTGASAGALAACYEYSPYGEPLRSETVDPVVADQPFRFSTKFFDGETGLYDYGHRYYSPSQGRFLGRDPSEEKGGLNLYGFCGNNAINRWDYLGMTPWGNLHDAMEDQFWDDKGSGNSLATANIVASSGGVSLTGAAQIILNTPNKSNAVSSSATSGLFINFPSLLQSAARGAAYVGQQFDSLQAKATQVDSSLGLLVTTIGAVAMVAGGELLGAAGGAESTALKFTQKTASPWFSAEGNFAGLTISDVASQLRAGTLTVADVPIQVVGSGIVNTRSSLSLMQAGIPQSEWVLIDMTGNAQVENSIAKRLLDNGLGSSGTDVIRITGSGGNASTLIGGGTLTPPLPVP